MAVYLHSSKLEAAKSEIISLLDSHASSAVSVIDSAMSAAESTFSSNATSAMIAEFVPIDISIFSLAAVLDSKVDSFISNASVQESVNIVTDTLISSVDRTVSGDYQSNLTVIDGYLTQIEANISRAALLDRHSFRRHWPTMGTSAADAEPQVWPTSVVYSKLVADGATEVIYAVDLKPNATDASNFTVDYIHTSVAADIYLDPLGAGSAIAGIALFDSNASMLMSQAVSDAAYTTETLDLAASFKLDDAASNVHAIGFFLENQTGDSVIAYIQFGFDTFLEWGIRAT